MGISIYIYKILILILWGLIMGWELGILYIHVNYHTTYAGMCHDFLITSSSATTGNAMFSEFSLRCPGSELHCADESNAG